MPSTILPTLRYADAPAAIEWLCSVLGFARHVVYEGPDNTIAHAQLTLGDGMIMLGSAGNANAETEYGRGFKIPAEISNIETGSRYVIVSDDALNATHARAATSEGQITRPLADTDYGSREFTVRDPEGNSWTVGTYDPWATHPAE